MSLRASLVLLLALAGCHKKVPVESPELVAIRAEQRALKAQVEALQARLEARATPEVALPSIAQPSVAPPSVAQPETRPLLTNTSQAEPSALPPATPAPSPLTAILPGSPSTPSTLRTEDLHGAPVGGVPSSAAGIPDAEGAVLLEQLKAQMQQLQTSQAKEQAALDAIERER